MWQWISISLIPSLTGSSLIRQFFGGIFSVLTHYAIKHLASYYSKCYPIIFFSHVIKLMECLVQCQCTVPMYSALMLYTPRHCTLWIWSFIELTFYLTFSSAEGTLMNLDQVYICQLEDIQINNFSDLQFSNNNFKLFKRK